MLIYIYIRFAATDVGAIAEGFVSVTPLQLDLTSFRALTDLNTWHWDEPVHQAALLEEGKKLSLFRTD